MENISFTLCINVTKKLKIDRCLVVSLVFVRRIKNELIHLNSIRYAVFSKQTELNKHYRRKLVSFYLRNFIELTSSKMLVECADTI